MKLTPEQIEEIVDAWDNIGALDLIIAGAAKVDLKRLIAHIRHLKSENLSLKGIIQDRMSSDCEEAE